MVRRWLIACLVALVAGGCATYRNDSSTLLQSLPQRYGQFDARLAWEIKTGSDGATINGVIQNVRYVLMDDVEVQVAVLTGDGREIDRDTCFVSSLKENEAAPFVLRLPPVTPGTQLRFRYRYNGYDGGGKSADSDTWRQSFDWRVP